MEFYHGVVALQHRTIKVTKDMQNKLWKEMERCLLPVSNTTSQIKTMHIDLSVLLNTVRGRSRTVFSRTPLRLLLS